MHYTKAQRAWASYMSLQYNRPPAKAEPSKQIHQQLQRAQAPYRENA